MTVSGTIKVCFKTSGSYGKGTAVTDIAMDSFGTYTGGRWVEVVAGLTNQATRGAARALAAGQVSLGSNNGIVIRLVDNTGDGTYESATIVDSA